MEEDNSITRIADLNPQNKSVKVLAKVLSVGESREINTRYGSSRHVTEAVIGDDSGTVILSLWDDQVSLVSEGDVIFIDNGYISLVRGHMRLNVGKYGSINASDETVESVNEELNMSDKEYPQERRNYRSNYNGGSGGGRRYR